MYFHPNYDIKSESNKYDIKFESNKFDIYFHPVCDINSESNKFNKNYKKCNIFIFNNYDLIKKENKIDIIREKNKNLKFEETLSSIPGVIIDLIHCYYGALESIMTLYINKNNTHDIWLVGSYSTCKITDVTHNYFFDEKTITCNKYIFAKKRSIIYYENNSEYTFQDKNLFNLHDNLFPYFKDKNSTTTTFTDAYIKLIKFILNDDFNLVGYDYHNIIKLFRNKKNELNAKIKNTIIKNGNDINIFLNNVMHYIHDMRGKKENKKYKNMYCNIYFKLNEWLFNINIDHFVILIYKQENGPLCLIKYNLDNLIRMYKEIMITENILDKIRLFAF
jgi:hypothetical protein